MNFSPLKIHQKCSTGKCRTLTLSHSLSVPPVIRCLFTDHFVCPPLNSAIFFPMFLGGSRNKLMPPADTQLWLGICPNLGETMLVSVTLGPALIFSAWRFLIQSLLGSHQEIMSRCWLQNDTSISRIKITWIFHGFVRYRQLWSNLHCFSW